MSEYIYETNGKPFINDKNEIVLARENIVRCRDCKYLNIVGKCPCGFWALEKLDGFCAWGERIDE